MNYSAFMFSMVVLGAITFGYRFSFISNPGRKFAARIPQDFLKLLAPATFAAIIANNIFAHPGEPQVLKLKLFVLLLASFVAYFSKSKLATLVFGLVLLYSIQNY